MSSTLRLFAFVVGVLTAGMLVAQQNEDVRYVNAAGACLALILLMGSIVRNWHTLTRRSRRVSLWLYAMLVAVAYGSLDAARQDVPIAPRSFVVTAVLIGLIASMVWHPEGDTDIPAQEKGTRT